MNLKIDTWREFRLGNLFAQIYKATAYNKEDLTVCNRQSENTIRYITRTDMNNACECLVLDKELMNTEEGNAITIGDTTANCYYQSERFVAGDHMVVLRSDWLNEYRGLFIISLIKCEKYKYSYGRAFLKGKIADTTIPLPILYKSGEPVIDDKREFSDKGYIPDWSFMETFICSLSHKPITTSIIGEEMPKLTVSKWKEYPLGKLFKIYKGKRLTKADMIEGKDNFLGAIDSNNGVRQKISAEKLWDENCITVNYNGSVGEAFYQSEPFWASDDVNILYPDGWELNKYIGLFLATIIKAERPKYNYGRKWTKSIMEKSIIKLPTKNEQPDWNYMEQYIKALPYSDRI
jgi:hypothetical protein